MNSPDATLVIAVCTLGRPQTLSRLLRSIAAQDSAEGWRVVVIDNDDAASALSVVDSEREAMPVPLGYAVEPRSGFASVRNAALVAAGDAADVCFIDDDAVVPAGWVSTMLRTREQFPLAIVRSRYAHVHVVPEDPSEVAAAVDRLRPLDQYGPAGTSGLLLPWRTRGGLRFDTYYDQSGGEDLDLLLRLERSGAQTVIADTVVLERQRVGALPMEDQLRLARWNGALSIIIRTRAGAPTRAVRWRARWEALSAITRAAISTMLRKEAAAAGYRGMAVGRWAMATAPGDAPVQIGSRPVL